MYITKRVDYAIRMLLALLKQGGKGKVKELSESLTLPYNHLTKLIAPLSHAGILITRKGKGGGVELGRSARKITLVDIYTALEGPIALSDCLLHKRSCSLSGNCNVRKYLLKVQQEIKKMFKCQTLYFLSLSK